MPNSRSICDRFGWFVVGFFLATSFFGCKSDNGDPASVSLASIPKPTALAPDCPIYGAHPIELVEKGCIFPSDKPYVGPSKSILRIALGSDNHTFHRLDRSEIVTHGIIAVELLNNTDMPQSMGWNGDFCRGSAVEIIGVNTLENHPPQTPGALHVMLPKEVIRRRIDFRKNPFGKETLWPLKNGCYDAVFSFWGQALKDTVRICYTGEKTVENSQNLSTEHACDALNKLAGSAPEKPLANLTNRPWPFSFPPNQLPDVNRITPDGITPLMWAAAHGNEALANWLLDNGALPDGDAIVAASLANKKEIIAVLLKHGARLDTSSLQRVAAMNSPAMIEFLIENASLENDNYRLVWAVRFANPSYVRALLESGADANFLRSRIDNYPLVEAIRRGNLEIISILLEHHAIAELQDLVEASFQGSDTARLIVQQGVDPNANFSMSHEFPFFVSKIGDTPMTAVVRENSINTIKALLDNGADLTTRGRSQMTPLVAAADACAYFSSKYIIEQKGEVPNEERNAAIIAAQRGGCPLLAAFLRRR
jgi:ankyrin repeat protein